ncbi:hypothetical protein O1432_09895 [Bacteroides fragilis]|uniref:hypothetical protein n=1 Tax=Bacteroides fragilis TaxID=817 RepID=UPI0022AA9405|nr:hypothetical protein [Bacteroides fragilis]MCZ2616495.1 hypothetical protein [Bacteroides fragilis]MCZ2624416.1 hypothetical protein [Bacteroides fragilis]
MIQEFINMIKELSGRDILFLSFYCGFILILSIHRSDEKASVDGEEEKEDPHDGPEPEK